MPSRPLRSNASIRFSLGAASKRDLERIAHVINEEKLDIVALQEVLSEGNGLLSLKNRLRGNWTYHCPRQETRAKDNPYLSSDERGEVYAFLWNTDRFELLVDEKGQLIEPTIRVLQMTAGTFAASCRIRSFWAIIT